MALTQFSGLSGSIPNLNSYLLQLFALREMVGTPGFTQGANTFSAYSPSNGNLYIGTTYSVAAAGIRVASGTNVLIDWIDPTQTANNRGQEFLFTGGGFFGRAMNDAYSADLKWMEVYGGYAAGITLMKWTANAFQFAGTGDVLVIGSGGLGYGTGSGGTVTQATSKNTGVTLNKSNGQIVLNNSALAAGATARFQLTNSKIAGTDGVIVTLSGLVAATASYNVWVDGVGSGLCYICVKNISGGSLSEAIYLTFHVLKGATS